MPRRTSRLPGLNPSILHVSKSSPVVGLPRRATVVGSSRTATHASRSRRGVGRPHKERNMVVNRDRVAAQREPYLIYEDGVNYTPRPLSDPSFPAASDRAFAGLPAARTLRSATGPRTAGLRSTLSTLQTDLASSRSSIHTIASGSRFSIMQRQSRASAALSMVSGGLASLSELSWATEADETSEYGSSGDRAPSMFRLRKDPPPAQPEPRTSFTIDLTETDTMFLLGLPSRSEPADSEEGVAIAEENAAYERTVGAGRTVSHTATQTNRVFQKHRRLYAPRATRRNAVAWATVWDIYDTYEEATTAGTVVSGEGGEEGQVDDTTVAVAKTDDDYDTEIECSGHKLNGRFLDALMLMERLVVKDDYSESQLLFRRSLSQDPLSLDVKYNYSLKTLWTFADPKTACRCVTSMCWSGVDGNVLAVGYGKFKYSTEKTDGLVCLWNVKNPANPERMYRFDEPVTFVVFSEARSHILAVTFYSGRVLLIDIVSRTPLVKASNAAYPLYHPVWQARWFPVDDDVRGQFLVTCGGNGRVYQYRKTEFFVSKKLLTVSRPHGNIQGVEQPRKCHARKTLSTRGPSAEVLALHPADPQRYLVGTSEGYVYVCSAHHRHDYADVFVAHDGPVYEVQFNPFCAKVFLTCGADWCVRVWAETVYEPLATLESGPNAVQCALWDPARSTVIASGAGDRLQVWDLRRSAGAPKGGAATPGGGRVTALQFAAAAPHSLCVGGDDGRVHVLALAEMPFGPNYQERVLVEAIDQLLITRPATLARLRKLGAPFTPPEHLTAQERGYRRLTRLNKDIL